MSKKALSETASEATAVAAATADIIEGSAETTALVAGNGITGDLDASDISFPRLQIVQGMGNLPPRRSHLHSIYQRLP